MWIWYQIEVYIYLVAMGHTVRNSKPGMIRWVPQFMVWVFIYSLNSPCCPPLYFQLLCHLMHVQQVRVCAMWVISQLVMHLKNFNILFDFSKSQWLSGLALVFAFTQPQSWDWLESESWVCVCFSVFFWYISPAK